MKKNTRTPRQNFIRLLTDLGLDKKEIRQNMADGIFAVQKKNAIFLFECEAEYSVSVFPSFDKLKANPAFIARIKELYTDAGLVQAMDGWIQGLQPCPLNPVDLYEVNLTGSFATCTVFFEKNPAVNSKNNGTVDDPDFVGYRIALTENGNPPVWSDNTLYRTTEDALAWVNAHNSQHYSIVISNVRAEESEMNPYFAWFIFPYYRTGDNDFRGDRNRTLQKGEHVYLFRRGRPYCPAIVVADTTIRTDNDKVELLVLGKIENDDDDTSAVHTGIYPAEDIYLLADDMSCLRCGGPLYRQHHDTGDRYWCPDCDVYFF